MQQRQGYPFVVLEDLSEEMPDADSDVKQLCQGRVCRVRSIQTQVAPVSVSLFHDEPASHQFIEDSLEGCLGESGSPRQLAEM